MAQERERSSTSNRGFASMDAARQREIASKGGQSVPNEKRSFSQNRQLAAEAGRKGGEASHGGRARRANAARAAAAAAQEAGGTQAPQAGQGGERNAGDAQRKGGSH